VRLRGVSIIEEIIFTVFQFLLVRLRVTMAGADPSKMVISIPSGAIKRIRKEQRSILKGHFNSFWCD